MHRDWLERAEGRERQGGVILLEPGSFFFPCISSSHARGGTRRWMKSDCTIRAGSQSPVQAQAGCKLAGCHAIQCANHHVKMAVIISKVVFPAHASSRSGRRWAAERRTPGRSDWSPGDGQAATRSHAPSANAAATALHRAPARPLAPSEF